MNEGDKTGTDSTSDANTSEENTTDSRLNDGDIKKISDLIVKITREKAPNTQEDLDKDKKQKELDKEKESNPEIDGLKKEVQELKKVQTEYVDKRKNDLLSQLNDKDRVKYKDKSLESLEMIVDYIKENPKRGVSRTPKSTDADDKKRHSDMLRQEGRVGTFNVKTREWE